MSFPSSRFEAGKDGRRRIMKHPANVAKLVRGALFSDNKTHEAKKTPMDDNPFHYNSKTISYFIVLLIS